jgi:hypothetical protein
MPSGWVKDRRFSLQAYFLKKVHRRSPEGDGSTAVANRIVAGEATAIRRRPLHCRSARHGIAPFTTASHHEGLKMRPSFAEP